MKVSRLFFFVGFFLSPLHLGDNHKRSRICLKTNNNIRQVSGTNQAQVGSELFITSKNSGIFNLLEIKRNGSVRLYNYYAAKFPFPSFAAILDCQEMPLFRVFGEKKSEICFSNIINTSMASCLLKYLLFKIVPWKSLANQHLKCIALY